jgi:hypothetical protein
MRVNLRTRYRTSIKLGLAVLASLLPLVATQLARAGQKAQPAGGSLGFTAAIGPDNLDSVQQSIRRTIILPESEDVNNADGLSEAIGKYLSQQAGWYVAPSDLAQELATRHSVPNSVLDAINPDTGAVDMQVYLQPPISPVVAIARETHSNAVLEVKVLKVKARVRNFIAVWDGVTEPVTSREVRVPSLFRAIEGNGWVYAATADMSLWSPAGMLLWKRRRGFAVLGVQTAPGAQFHERPLTEVYQNAQFMHSWLAGTFGEFASARAEDTRSASAQAQPR